MRHLYICKRICNSMVCEVFGAIQYAATKTAMESQEPTEKDGETNKSELQYILKRVY